MAAVITMPKFGLTMETGTVTAWYKKVGEKIEKGELLAEIETDKITNQFESPHAGFLLGVIVAEGGQARVREPICMIGEQNETVDLKPVNEGLSKVPATAAAPVNERSAGVSGNGRIPVSPVARKLADEHGIDLSSITGSGPGGRIIREDIEAAIASRKTAASAARPAARGVPISPRARKLIAEKGLDPSAFASSGTTRVTEEDVLRYLERMEGSRVALAGVRRIIAERMSMSKRTIPHFYLRVCVDASEMVKMRQSLDFAPAYNDMIIKAAALSMKEHPRVNARYTEKEIVVLNECNIGLAVSLEDGLIVPVVQGAQNKTLRKISEETKSLIDRARAGTLGPDDVTGGTCTLTNLGMFGIDEFMAIINPPESAIMAAGQIKDAVVAVDKQVVVRPQMILTLSVDHRVIDGSLAARFLGRIKQLLEIPCPLLG
jgi:pyruvate dehydrogenase E2 component (dihydrolipoamide acetyltransferase)